MRFPPAILLPVEEPDVHREPVSLRAGPLSRFDRWSLGVIFVVFLILVANFGQLKPSMSDTWYHLTVAKQMVQSGWTDGWDRWHYAPVGRPHLYPPLLHVILAFLGSVTGSIITAGQICAASFLPLSMLTIWYCARRILDPRLAFLATLLPLIDFLHFVVMEAYIAGCLVNILMPLLMVAFLSRRTWWSILLLTLIYYSHLGFSHCVAAGLLLFGLKYRSYLRPALKVIGISLVFFTPWLAHVIGHIDWLPVLKQGGMPGNPLEKVMSLQSANLAMLGFGIWGITVAPKSDPARRLPIFLLIGFLPILFAYGGRYSMHTMPLWAILGASVLGFLLPEGAQVRRVLGVIGLTFLPLPTLSFMGGFVPIPLTASHMLLIVMASDQPGLGGGERTEAYGPDCEAVAYYLKATTEPDEVIHVNTVWVAEMVSLLADRRTDHGAWWECSKESAKLYGRALRDWSPTATFVCIRPEADAGSVLEKTPPMPGVDRKFALGRFDIGVRKPPSLRPAGVRVRKWSALSMTGASSEVETAGGKVKWTFPATSNTLALISARAPKGRFAGLRFRLSSSRMDGRLELGIRTTDGKSYGWPLSIAEPETNTKVRVVFRWMHGTNGEAWENGKVEEIYLSRPPEQVKGKKADEKQTVTITGMEMLVEE